MSFFKPFKISICPRAKTPEQMNTAPFGWETIEVNSFEDIKKFATVMPYSSSEFKAYNNLPMVEKDGKKTKDTQRKQKNVIGLHPLAIFDIDDGLSMKDTKKILDEKNLQYMMLTTKSHGTEKAAGADRFRLFIPLAYAKKINFHNEGIELPTKARDRAFVDIQLKFFYSEIAKELGIVEFVDPSPLSDIARKYVPSPSNAEFIVNNYGKQFDITNAGKSSFKLAEETINELHRKREVAKKIKEKSNTYEYHKERKNFSNYIDFSVLYSLDIGEVIRHFETENGETTRYYQEGNYTYVHNETHKFSIMFDEAKGEYVYHDFKSGESGNILSYMRGLIPYISNFDIAVMMQQEFKKELLNAKIIKKNPAYYIEPLLEKLKKHDHYSSMQELKKEYLQEVGLKDMSITKKAKLFTVDNKNYTAVIPIPSDIIGELNNNLKISVAALTKKNKNIEEQEQKETPKK